MVAIFKKMPSKSNDVLLGKEHVIAIFREKHLVDDWKKKYKPPTSWRKFIHNKKRQNNFGKGFLECIKQIVYSLGYYMNALGDCVYYSKNMPLFVHINEDWFIGIAPIRKGVDY